MTDRSNRAVVRNPMLALPSVNRLMSLPDEPREALIATLLDLKADAAARAADSWRRHKGPMALYWKAVSVYAGHLAKALRRAAIEKRNIDHG